SDGRVLGLVRIELQLRRRLAVWQGDGRIHLDRADAGTEQVEPRADRQFDGLAADLNVAFASQAHRRAEKLDAHRDDLAVPLEPGDAGDGELIGCFDVVDGGIQRDRWAVRVVLERERRGPADGLQTLVGELDVGERHGLTERLHRDVLAEAAVRLDLAGGWVD